MLTLKIDNHTESNKKILHLDKLNPLKWNMVQSVHFPGTSQRN